MHHAHISVKPVKEFESLKINSTKHKNVYPFTYCLLHVYFFLGLLLNPEDGVT
jgi:hypothetical protein